MKFNQLLNNVIEQNVNFIVVTGGVCSSIGKGVLVSSLGVLLKNANYSVAVVKWDPYLNVDPGTMSPLEHGEVFVTRDGAETDLDLGHYERILDISLTRDSSVSSGQIFQEILEGERKGDYLGKCIQLVPHVVTVVKKRLFTFALKHKPDFVLLEIGGTVGDIEGQVFLEAVRQVRMDLGQSKVLHAHLSYLPFLKWTGEVKTKPTQHSVNSLKEVGLVPDALFLRAVKPISKHAVEKLSVMCGVARSLIFEVLTQRPVYNLFIELKKQLASQRVQEYFGIPSPSDSDLSDWQSLIDQINQVREVVKIGIIAKYVGSNDPYISLVEAIKVASYACNVKAEIVVIDAEKLEKSDAESESAAWKKLKSLDGIVGPGGFDVRGSEGKILAVRWARGHNIPYLGLCLGLQVMLIEIARSLAGLEQANSTEFAKETPYPVISLLEEQREIAHKGASMRLGESVCTVIPGTQAYKAYGVDQVSERHRHRYEFNNDYKKNLEDVGVVFSGVNQELDLIEIAELKDHPFMLGSQFHPEFLSRPLKPHPLFLAFMKAVIAQKGLN